jgi:hypothetical protein
MLKRISRYTVHSVRYYPRFHVVAVVFGMYYPWIRVYYCIYIFFLSWSLSLQYFHVLTELLQTS